MFKFLFYYVKDTEIVKKIQDGDVRNPGLFKKPTEMISVSSALHEVQ